MKYLDTVFYALESFCMIIRTCKIITETRLYNPSYFMICKF